MSWPSFSKASSGSPGAQEARPLPETSRAMTFSAGDSEDHARRRPTLRTRTRCPGRRARSSETSPSPTWSGARPPQWGSPHPTTAPASGASERACATTARSAPDQADHLDGLGGPPHPSPGQRDRRHRRHDLDRHPESREAWRRSPTPADPPTPERPPRGRRTPRAKPAAPHAAARATAPAPDPTQEAPTRGAATHPAAPRRPGPGRGSRAPSRRSRRRRSRRPRPWWAPQWTTWPQTLS